MASCKYVDIEHINKIFQDLFFSDKISHLAVKHPVLLNFFIAVFSYSQHLVTQVVT